MKEEEIENIKQSANLRDFATVIGLILFKGVIFLDEEDEEKKWTIVILSAQNTLSMQGWNLQVKFNMQKNPDKLSIDALLSSTLIKKLIHEQFTEQYSKIGTIIEAGMKITDERNESNTNS